MVIFVIFGARSLYKYRMEKSNQYNLKNNSFFGGLEECTGE